jgi:GAF domain-containing protein
MTTMTATDTQKFLESGYQLVSQSQDLEATISQLVQKAVQVAGSDMGSLYLLDETKKVLRPFVTINLPQEYVDGCKEVEVGAQCCGRAVLHRMPWFVENMETDPLFREAREAARRSGVGAAFSVPVITEAGECLGSLAAHFKHPHAPTADVVEVVQLCASVIAAAVSRYKAGKPAGSVAAPQARSVRSA